MSEQGHTNTPPDRRQLRLLVLGALGVVYGDIGTSPLYAVRECFSGSHPVAATPENVLGILSLVFWALLLVISIKYMVFVTRADNRGEGGILALMAMAHAGPAAGNNSSRRFVVLALGLFGASLLYGDGMITPAISVLSAVEGLKLATPMFEQYVVPITLVILVALFLFQRHGTARLGAVFGPIILLWFLCIALLGLTAIVEQPSVLKALNPWYAVRFMAETRGAGFLVLGAVFLAVTGGEALYADMGHFGRHPIQLGWFYVALPALLLNYFGQGAVILSHPASIENPFYSLAPSWAILPLVVLATFATIIASQAVITGAFSLTRQAVLLGYLPRIAVVHTSSREIGQIYIPFINQILLLATISLVIGFKTSSHLAAAYGVAVTTTMLITTLLLYVVAREVWRWHWLPTAALTGAFLVFDAGFCGAAMLKIGHGGWFPLLIGLSVYAVMTTWRRGREILRERLGDRVLPFEMFVRSIVQTSPDTLRVPGSAVFMSGHADSTPRVLLHNIKCNKVLHETTVALTVVIEDTSHVPLSERVRVKNLGLGFFQVEAHYGFMESPQMAQILDLCRPHGLDLDLRATAFFLGHENIKSTSKPRMARWRERLFAFMTRNAQDATGFFGIPPNQVVELGIQVEL